MHYRLRAYSASFFLHLCLLLFLLLYKLPSYKVVDIDLTEVEIKKEVVEKEISKPSKEIKPEKLPETVKKKPSIEEQAVPEAKSEVEIPKAEGIKPKEGGVQEMEKAISEKARKEGEAIEATKELREEFLREKLGVISSIVKQNLTYPPLARKLGMEGKMVISFLLTKDGRVEDIKIEQSTGYRLLDENAIKTVKRLEKLMLKPPVDVRIKLPVIYRLESTTLA